MGSACSNPRRTNVPLNQHRSESTKNKDDKKKPDSVTSSDDIKTQHSIDISDDAEKIQETAIISGDSIETRESVSISPQGFVDISGDVTKAGEFADFSNDHTKTQASLDTSDNATGIGADVSKTQESVNISHDAIKTHETVDLSDGVTKSSTLLNGVLLKTKERIDNSNDTITVEQKSNVVIDKGKTTRISTNNFGTKIMIMNTGGGAKKQSGENPTDRRKRAIFEVVTTTRASLVLFQEFNWVGIDSRGWKNFNWPDYYVYTGHKDASILYDKNEVTSVTPSQNTMDSILTELIRLGRVPQGFTPFPRMCARIIKTQGIPIIEFLCISWHGRHNIATYEDLLDEFRSILNFILELAEKTHLSVLLAGDFNVKLKDIEAFVPPELMLHKYEPTYRRVKEAIIDFYVTSKSLLLSKMEAIRLDLETNVNGVLDLFDHDPVVTFLSTNNTS